MINVKGKTVVLTGTFASLPCRTDIVARLRLMGATVKGSVDKNTDILFCGWRAGAKSTKAQELGITVYKTSGLRQVLAQPIRKPHYSRLRGGWCKWTSRMNMRHYCTGLGASRSPNKMPKGWTPANRGTS